VFVIVLVAAGLGGGFHMRERPAEPPTFPSSRCANGADCGASPDGVAPEWKLPPSAAPLRECPADSSMVTVHPGVRYCIPDRPIRG